MDWQPIREAVRQACATATGIELEDVLLETERNAYNKSRGKRLRLDFEQVDTSEPARVYQELESGELVEVIVTERDLIINARFFTDDHRTASKKGGWAHELADRLASRLWLSKVAAIYEPVGLQLARTDVVLPNPQVIVDNRQMSVATLRIAFNMRACEFESEAPGDPNATTDYFDRVEINGRRPRAVYQRDLLALGPWRYLWLGEETDLAGGRIVQVSGDAQLRVGDPRQWQTNTGSLALEELDEGQLLPGYPAPTGQAIAIVFTAPQPGATISILGRSAGGIGWVLEGLSDGAVRLSVLGTGGTTTAQLPARLDGSERTYVIHNAGSAIGLYEGGASASAAVSGSHLAGDAALMVGPATGVSVRLLGQVVTDDPEGFRAGLVSALA